jgi:hypothetical protein
VLWFVTFFAKQQHHLEEFAVGSLRAVVVAGEK